MTDRKKTYTARHVRYPHIRLPHIRFSRRELTDRPLEGKPHPDQPFHWKLYAMEAIATAIMLLLGITVTTILAADGSPVAAFLAPYPILRSALIGLFFGLAGTIATLSPFGKVSGAHLNPSVTLAFFLSKKIRWLDALGYIFAQLIGAFTGTLLASLGLSILLPFWQPLVTQIHYAGTFPASHYSLGFVALIEGIATAGLILVIYFTASRPRLQHLTTWMCALYFAITNPFISGFSGNSTNFMRTLAPDTLAHNLHGIWIYLVGPFMGAAIALQLARFLVSHHGLREARIVNFGHHGRVPRYSAPEAKGPSPDELKREDKKEAAQQDTP
ncbi:MAG: aquaporin family protein [Bifidobacteriales bacterium]|nr:aquaporin family protein [Bifidobacteriales bacterium]